MYNLLNNLIGNEYVAAVIAAALPLFVFILPFALAAVLLERKVSAFMQDRLGPNRTGYRGLLQTVADILKLIQKEDITATDADKKLFNLAPVLVFAGCYAAFAAIPFSGAYIGADIDLGMFFIVAISSLVVAGILMGGWASNNKYSLIGAMRSAAQMISYEIPTALVILSLVLVTGTLSLHQISEQQTAYFWNWNILGGAGLGFSKLLLIPFMIVGFIIIYISSLAEVNRTPFDIPEAESELVAGFHTEYSGMKFAMFFLAEYANMFAVSSVVAALFFGGYQSPFGYLGNTLGISWLVPLEQFFWFTAKGMFFVLVQMWLRWTLPRLRVDQLMTVCWKYLIPYAFVNLIIVGLITLL
ncbi:MAG: NADH-quinone oxidoreductase subunit NuoH [Bacteroidota bacterium]|jgi:NADH-quinone oxidoreductase subunit H|nr:NADH-quinone oxidoreductase subunit NuoH [Ignavibacteria bacterium]MCU7500342.1 NADH-quinone oxidoreductase subunit NuoH [Ignavibacteria bacterium]MCU7501780.1 NADH-quinone oxidoreductase subunit NuoH [Ignavibacteria bacterium]MCU7511896.1 NADH-quinone oxidoreductase subunit NuoH [Ignavibacteria bacterium]MCU7516813.1 NADH-quinone oxidoreductase subunit NuoH [Ignavibacteria bacterium]